MTSWVYGAAARLQRQDAMEPQHSVYEEQIRCL